MTTEMDRTVATVGIAERPASSSAFALLIVQAGLILAAMDYSIYNFALPLILDDLNISIPSAGLIFFLSQQGTFIGTLLVAIVADYVGRVRVMMGNIALYSVATGAVAFAPSALFLTVVRFLVNFGVGAEHPVGAAYISETWDPTTRGRALAFMQSGFAIGTLFASLLLAVVGSRYGWRVLFLIGLLPALLVIVIRSRLPESRMWEEHRARKAALTTRRDVDAAVRFPWVQLFAGDLRKLTMIGIVLLIVGNSGAGGVFAWGPTFLKSARGLDISTVGWFGVVLALGMFVGYNAFGFIADVIGRRFTMAIYFALGGLSVVAFSFVTNLIMLAVVTLFVGFTIAGVFSGFVIYLPELFPTRARASGIGLCMGIGLFFWALVPYVLGLLAPGGDFSGVFAVSSVAAYVVGLVILLFAPETKGKVLA